MVTQIAVFMENRQGRILNLTNVLKQNNVDLLTLSIADTKDFGILRCIARDNEKAEKVLKQAGFTITTTKLIGVMVEDKPGGLAEVLELLENGNINIDYLYSFAHKTTKTAIILFKVSNEEEALKILKENNIKTLEQSEL